MEQWTGSKLGKEYIKAVCFHPAYLTYIQNARQNEAQAGIKIAGRNITNLRYADNTSVMAESEQELKSLLMTVKEESEKLGLKLNIQKTHVNPWLIHVDVWQKPSQYCKVISLQLNKLKKLNIQKMKTMASGAITSWQIDGETMETVRLYFLGLQNH